MQLQRSAGNAAMGRFAPPVVHDVLARPGQPLDGATRVFMGSRLGADFRDVRVHTDAQAAESARGVSARAYTVGHDIVFGDGHWQPHTTAGRRLLAHELAHVVQQRGRGGEKGLLQRELISSAGYPNRFANAEAEIGCAESPPATCKWSPSSVDFAATATNSGGGTAIGTFSGLLDHIAAQAPGSITELGLIGHADSADFGLSGTITAHDVFFSTPGLINDATITANLARIAGMRDRFGADAQIVLYGCNAGVGLGLLEALSRAFHVCVLGFSDEIFTCFIWAPRERSAGHPRHITHRGNVWTPVTTDPLPPDRPALCKDWHTNVRELTPDRRSCVGVPPTPTEPGRETRATGPKRFGVEVRAGAAWSDESWRAAVGLGMRYSLRPDRAVIWNPTLGAHLVYLPTSGDRVSHIAATIAELGLRLQQPLKGFYVDVRAGGYVGLEVPGSGSTGKTQVIGGFTPALGLGYHSERLSIGAEARGFVGAGPDQFVIVGVGAWHW